MKARVYTCFCFVKAIVALLFATCCAQAQVITQYSDTTVGAITDLSCNQPTGSQITRTFAIPTAFTVGDVNIGIFLDHSYRSDLRLFLTSPAGTIVSLLPWTSNAQSGNNLNDMFDDEAAASIATHGATLDDPLTPAPAPPAIAYSHAFQPANPLSVFDGQNAQGNWILRICDAVNIDTGNFRRADLFITSTSLNVTKSSSIVSDGISGGNPKALPGAVVRYCILATNTGPTVMTNVRPTDILPPMMTYIAGSLLSGASCTGAATVEDEDNSGADETDPVGASVVASTIAGDAPNLAGGASFALVFQAVVN
ncbi:MAG: proprotein convertase P-domain-containing protein [Sphingorhabdus sp.]